MNDRPHRSFSRNRPTPHYRRLVEFYQSLHHDGGQFEVDGKEAKNVRLPPEQMFQGGGLLDFAPKIRDMVFRHSARSILDYGAGKGLQYDKNRALLDGRPVDVREYWGVKAIEVYDPGFDSDAQPLPADGVICTDVLEHCYYADIPWIVEEIFSFARLFVWCNIDSFPARKTLPNGENVHITVRHPQYWRGVFETTGNRFPEIEWEIGCRLADSKDPLAMKYFSRVEVENFLTGETRFIQP